MQRCHGTGRPTEAPLENPKAGSIFQEVLQGRTGNCQAQLTGIRPQAHRKPCVRPLLQAASRRVHPSWRLSCVPAITGPRTHAGARCLSAGTVLCRCRQQTRGLCSLERGCATAYRKCANACLCFSQKPPLKMSVDALHRIFWITFSRTTSSIFGIWLFQDVNLCDDGTGEVSFGITA